MTRPSRELILLGLYRISRSIAAGMIFIAFPYYILRSLKDTSLTLGFLYAAAALATAALGLLFGFLADVWSRKKTLFLVGLMLPVSSAILLISSRLPVLFAATMVGGYSATGSLMGGGIGGASQPIQSAVIADLTLVQERTFYFSFFSFLSGGFAAAGALLARLFTVKGDFEAATVVATVGLVCLLPMRLRDRHGELLRLRSKRTIGQFSFTGALNGFAQGLITPFLIPFFVIVYHVPRAQMSVYGFISGTLGALALLTARSLELRLGFVRSIAVTRGLGILLLLLLPLVHWYHLALAIYFITPALRVAALPTQQTAITEMVDLREWGRALGFNQVTRLTASSGAIAFTGAMFAEADIGLPFYVYALVMTLNIYLYFRFFGARESELASARASEEAE